jgi:uncharacterized protein (TIGR02265 family)
MSLASVPLGFRPPDDLARVDVEACIRDTPAERRLRGMFFLSYLEEAERRGLVLRTERTYAAFKLYPVREWQRFIVDAASVLEPGQPIGGGLRRLGLRAYPTFASSMIGRVIFGVLGRDLGRVLRTAPKGFEHSLEGCEVKVVESDDRFIRLHLREVYGFLGTYNLGVFQGAMDACERPGEVYHRPISLGEGEVFCRW